MNKKKLAAIALMPLLGATALGASVYAASGTSTTPSNFITNKLSKMGLRGSHDNTAFASDLASVLGLTTTDVKAKLDAGTTPDAIILATGKTVADVEAQLKALRIASLTTKLQAEVTAGTITQAQATAKITKETNGIKHDFGGREKGPGPRDTAMFAKGLASVLGLSETDVKAKLDAGTTPEAIITATGKNATDVMTQLKTLRDTNMKAQLAADVASGKITQAQALEMITNMTNHTGMHVGGPHGAHKTTSTTSTSTQ